MVNCWTCNKYSCVCFDRSELLELVTFFFGSNETQKLTCYFILIKGVWQLWFIWGFVAFPLWSIVAYIDVPLWSIHLVNYIITLEETPQRQSAKIQSVFWAVSGLEEGSDPILTAGHGPTLSIHCHRPTSQMEHAHSKKQIHGHGQNYTPQGIQPCGCSKLLETVTLPWYQSQNILVAGQNHKVKEPTVNCEWLRVGVSSLLGETSVYWPTQCRWQPAM